MLHRRAKSLGGRIAICALGLPSAAAFADSLGEARSAIEMSFQRTNDLASSLESISDADREDRSTITKYYERGKQLYVVAPLNNWLANSTPVVTNFATGVDRAIQDLGTEISAPELSTYKVAFQSCVGASGALKGALSDFTNAGKDATRVLAQPFPSRIRDYALNTRNWSSSAKMDSAAEVFERDWSGTVRQCCQTSLLAPVAASAQSASSAALASACDKTVKRVAELQEKLKSDFKAPSLPQPADPIQNSNFNAHQLASVLENGRYGADITSARRSRDAGLEEDVFARAEADCQKEVARSQKRSFPIGHALSNFGKALKCGVLPGLAATMGTPTLERIATGVGRAPIAGNGWDLMCDPREMDLYDAMTPMDPAGIAKQWNLDQLANPPYIQMMRIAAQTPLSTPFPMMPLIGGGVATPYDITSNTLVNGNASLGTAKLATASTGKSTSTSTRRVASSRGVAYGAAFSRGTRALASEITQGKQTLRNASVLSSGASNSRKLVSKMVENNRKLSSESRRGLAASTSRQLSSSARKVSGTRVSRTTTSDALKSIKGRTTTKSGTGTVGNIDTQARDAERERQRLKMLSQSYMDNINLTIEKSQTIKIEMQKQIAARDIAISQAIQDMINMSPKKRAERSKNLRTEVTEIDKQLGVLKAQVDVLQSAVNEQGALMRNLAIFGTAGSQYSGTSALASTVTPSGFPSRDGRGSSTTRDSSSGGGTGGVPTSSPSAFLEAGRILGTFLEWMIPERSAFAATTGEGGLRLPRVWRNDEEWRREWASFVKDLEAYGRLKAEQEKAAGREVSDLMLRRAASITVDTAVDIDTDTITALDSYSRALDEESDDLIKAATLGAKSSSNLDGNVLGLLRQTRDDAREARAGVDELSLQYKDSYPKRFEDNPEAWWALLPQTILE